MEQNEILYMLTREMKIKLGKHLKKIVLFGSRARGDHEPDSDYDLLVVLDKISPSIKDKIYEIGGELLYNHNIVLSFFPILENIAQQDSHEPFLINAQTEGLVCYESAK